MELDRVQGFGFREQGSWFGENWGIKWARTWNMKWTICLYGASGCPELLPISSSGLFEVRYIKIV